MPRLVTFASWALLALPAPVLAAEGESSLSVTPSYATFQVGTGDDEIAMSGGTLLLEYERGISDTLWVRAAAGGGAYDGAGTFSGMGVFGITYAFDVLRYVPWVNLGIGGMYLRGGPVTPGVRTFVEMGLGLDVLHSTTFSYGVAARFDSFASDIVYFQLGPRLTWRWGYF